MIVRTALDKTIDELEKLLMRRKDIENKEQQKALADSKEDTGRCTGILAESLRGWGTG